MEGFIVKSSWELRLEREFTDYTREMTDNFTSELDLIDRALLFCILAEFYHWQIDVSVKPASVHDIAQRTDLSLDVAERRVARMVDLGWALEISLGDEVVYRPDIPEK